MNKIRVANRLFCIDDVFFEGANVFALVYDNESSEQAESTKVFILTRRYLNGIADAGNFPPEEFDGFITSDWIGNFYDLFFDAIQNAFPKTQRRATNNFLIVLILFVMLHAGAAVCIYYDMYYTGPLAYAIGLTGLTKIALNFKLI